MKQRRLEPEVMDDPALDAAAHERALRGLARLNRISRSVRTVWNAMADLAASAPSQEEPLRVLDVATGGGDVPIALHRFAQREGAALHIEGCDLSEVALDHARRAAERARVSSGSGVAEPKVAGSDVAGSGSPIRFFSLDALNEPLPAGYDVITCSLFLHHLTDEQAVELLWKMAAAAKRRIIVNDLHRSRLGLATVWIGTRLLTRSPVVHVDGPRSVRAAFTADEARNLARQAGLDDDAEVHRRGPWRWVLTWDRRNNRPE